MPDEKEILEKNLENVKAEYDLFGEKVEKLSMKDRIGFLPISVWEPDWTIVKKLKAIIGDKGQSRELVKGNTTFGNKELGASIFNPHLAQMIYSAYCPKNAKIYDPFGGGGTRGFIAAAMHHDYYGIELRQEEVNRILEKQKELERPFCIKQGDSRFFEKVFPDKNSFFDFSITCPPYYDLEVYSELKEDLSAAATYKDFLWMIKESLEGVHKALRKGGLSVWVVGNFRNKAGKLQHFNGDVIKIAEKYAGFDLLDELVWWGASKQASQRVHTFEANRKSVRVHEYIIILKKR